MPRKDQLEPEAPAAPAALKFIGSADSFVSGVPQGPLEVVEEPKEHHQVSREHALQLLASGLYVAAEKYEPPAPPAEEVSSGG